MGGRGEGDGLGGASPCGVRREVVAGGAALWRREGERRVGWEASLCGRAGGRGRAWGASFIREGRGNILTPPQRRSRVVGRDFQPVGAPQLVRAHGQRPLQTTW